MTERRPVQEPTAEWVIVSGITGHVHPQPTERDRLNHEAALDLASRIRSYCEPPRLASEGAAVIEALSREVGRLRGVVRVNALRHDPSITHEQIDEVLYGKR